MLVLTSSSNHPFTPLTTGTMGRSPCCDEIGVKKGPWTPEEDTKLVNHIEKHGHGSWRNLPKSAGLNRCGKSCRLRWTNYLRPDIKRGKFSDDEERLIIHLHSVLGNKWSAIATRLQGRTDNEIKNYWNTHLKKKLLLMGIDPVTHRRRTDLDLLSSLPTLLAAANLGNLTNPWDNALRLQADAEQLARSQILQGLVQVMTSGSPTNLDAMNLLGSASLRHHQFNDLVQLSSQLEGLINGSLSLSHGAVPTISGLSSLGIQQFLDNFHTSSESSLHPEKQQMVSQINRSCSTELVAESKGNGSNQMLFPYSIPAANSTPSLVSASTEDVSQEPINWNDLTANSSASTPFEAWEGLNLGDLDADLCWKEILDQI